MLPAEMRAAALKAVAELENERMGAWVTVNATEQDEGVRAAALGFLEKTAPRSIAILSERIDLIGEKDFPSWVATGDEIHKGIDSVAGYSTEWSMREVLLHTVSKTVDDTVAAAQKVASGAGVGAGLLTFVVLGIIAWKVLK